MLVQQATCGEALSIAFSDQGSCSEVVLSFSLTAGPCGIALLTPCGEEESHEVYLGLLALAGRGPTEPKLNARLVLTHHESRQHQKVHHHSVLILNSLNYLSTMMTESWQCDKS